MTLFIHTLGEAATQPHRPYYKALEIFSVQTLCDVGIFLSLISLLLHLAKPYFDRTFAQYRLLADIGSLGYVLTRDGLLFLALIIGIFHLNLDLMADIKVGLPFVPFATVVLAIVCIIKVWARPGSAFARWEIPLLALAVILNLAGFILVMEGPGDEYSAAKQSFWQILASWKSNENPEFATYVFYVCTGALLALAGLAVGLASGRRKNIATPSTPKRDEEAAKV